MVDLAETKNSSRRELERMFKRFLGLKFPIVDGNEELEDLHSTLVLFDADVAAAITRVLRSQGPSPELHSLLGLRDRPDLQGKIGELMTKYQSNNQTGQAVRQYEARYKVLKELIRAAHSYLDASDK